MPIIQLELKQALTTEQEDRLSEEAVQIVHESIGSAKAHINVVIRHNAGTRIVEAGDVHEK